MAVRAEQLPVTTVRLLPDRLDLVLILALALALRMLFILTTPINTAGGDTRWLLETGLQIVQNRVEQVPQTPPLYLLFNGLVQVVSGSASLEVIRVFNAIFGLITVALLYVIGCLYFNRRAGQMVAIAVAINPIFIIETGNILTESLFLPLFFGAIALYAFYTRGSYEHLWRGMALVGVLLGLATLTRAPTLALPAVFGLHLIVTFRWARGAPGADTWCGLSDHAFHMVSIYLSALGDLRVGWTRHRGQYFHRHHRRLVRTRMHRSAGWNYGRGWRRKQSAKISGTRRRNDQCRSDWLPAATGI